MVDDNKLEAGRGGESPVVTNDTLGHALCIKVLNEGGSDRSWNVVNEEAARNLAETAKSDYIAVKLIERIKGMSEGDRETTRQTIKTAVEAAIEAGGAIKADTVKALLQVVEATMSPKE